MVGLAPRRLGSWAQRTQQRLPAGFSWPFVIYVDITMTVIAAVAFTQRPPGDWMVAGIAVGIVAAPWVLFFFLDAVKYEGPVLWVAWTTATAILIFGTSTPIDADFAPLLLALCVSVVSATTSLRGGILAAISAVCLLWYAVVLHRVETAPLYFAWIGIGWVIGYLALIQQRLILKQQRMQAELAGHVAADERRRIAREVHDVIAHSLSVTLLHLTGARHLLDVTGGDVRAIQGLQKAEHLGRQAIADIRRTVGLLDANAQARTPEPGLDDIATLIEDFANAGVDVQFDSSGGSDCVSAAVGLALFRVAQESLANAARHAPRAPVTVALTMGKDEVALTVVNTLTVPAPDAASVAEKHSGRGLLGMRQRIELLGGALDIRRGPHSWSIRATVPLGAEPDDLCQVASTR